jgi:hypothetical protein
MPNRFLIPPVSDISKDILERVEFVNNKFGKSQKSNHEDKGFGIILVIMV